MENSNRNQQAESFYVYRGITRCLSAGISFLTDNFLYIVKVSLPFALAFAAIMSAIIYILSDSSFLQTITGPDSTSSTSKITLDIILIVLILLLFIAFALNLGLTYRMIHIKAHGISVRRYKMIPMLKASLPYANKSFWFMLAFGIIILLCGSISVLPFVYGGEGTIFTIIKFCILALACTLIFVLSIPANIALPAMFLEKGKPFSNSMSGYKKGFKIWGKVFCVLLLLGILILFLIFVFSMPSVIMICVYNAETLSLLNGDNVHLPTGFHIWYFLILLVTYYLYTFLFWLMTAPFSYLYASIKVNELEEARNQLAMPLY